LQPSGSENSRRNSLKFERHFSLSETNLSFLEEQFVSLLPLEKACLNQTHGEQHKQQNSSDHRQSNHPTFNFADWNAPKQNHWHVHRVGSAIKNSF